MKNYLLDMALHEWNNNSDSYVHRTGPRLSPSTFYHRRTLCALESYKQLIFTRRGRSYFLVVASGKLSLNKWIILCPYSCNQLKECGGPQAANRKKKPEGDLLGSKSFVGGRREKDRSLGENMVKYIIYPRNVFVNE